MEVKNENGWEGLVIFQSFFISFFFPLVVFFFCFLFLFCFVCVCVCVFFGQSDFANAGFQVLIYTEEEISISRMFENLKICQC